MKRHILAFALILVAAPTLADSDPKPPVMFLTPAPAADSCNSGALAYLIGVEADRVDNLNSMGRVWYPGSAGAMDYLPQRRNISVDEDGIITHVTCG